MIVRLGRPTALRLPPAVVLTATAALALSGCSTPSEALAVRTGTVDANLHRACAALQRELPDTLLGLHRRATTPSSDLVTAWGDPAVTLWCATAVPPQLDPGSPSYDPAGKRTTSIDVNGACWIVNATEHTADARPHPYTLSLVRRRIFLELRIPQLRNGIESPAPALTAAITRTDPVDPAQRFVCT